MKYDVVRGLEHHRILDAHPNQIVNTEESPVVDFGVYVLPVGQHVGLIREQLIQIPKAGGNSASSVEYFQVCIDECAELRLIFIKLAQPLLNRFHLQPP